MASRRSEQSLEQVLREALEAGEKRYNELVVRHDALVQKAADVDKRAAVLEIQWESAETRCRDAEERARNAEGRYNALVNSLIGLLSSISSFQG